MSVMKLPDQVVDRCTICGQVGVFDGTSNSIRETYECPRCRASLRYRAQAATILGLYSHLGVTALEDLVKTPTWSGMSVYEPGIIGPFRSLFRKCANYTQSFYWPDIPLGRLHKGIECQDLTKTTFPNETFDLIITSDIFEHIRRPNEAFLEIFRILRTGGYHVFTVPAQAPLQASTIQRVDVTGDTDKHLLPERYHGSGDGGKSLVYNDFGADLIQRLDGMGYKATLHGYAEGDPTLPEVFTFVAKKIAPGISKER